MCACVCAPVHCVVFILCFSRTEEIIMIPLQQLASHQCKSKNAKQLILNHIGV